MKVQDNFYSISDKENSKLHLCLTNYGDGKIVEVNINHRYHPCFNKQQVEELIKDLEEIKNLL